MCRIHIRRMETNENGNEMSAMYPNKQSSQRNGAGARSSSSAWHLGAAPGAGLTLAQDVPNTGGTLKLAFSADPAGFDPAKGPRACRTW